MPNTRRALAVAEFARDEGRLDAFRTAAMDAHWSRSEDLEADATLSALAGAVGLDPVKGLRAADDPAYVARVDAMGEEAARWGVTGIPTYFVLPDRWTPGDALPPEGSPRPVRVVGCQPYEVVERACRMAGVGRRSG
jgi:predicted DsbA family dithiol-disulfide isomerase